MLACAYIIPQGIQYDRPNAREDGLISPSTNVRLLAGRPEKRNIDVR
jgi:hypothetical protein